MIETKCALCSGQTELSIYDVMPERDNNEIMICDICTSQIQDTDTMDKHHWRCLTDSMWSPVPAVQVMAWRLLKTLNNEDWARNALDMLYLEDDVQAWAEAGFENTDNGNDNIPTKDSNGATLEAGDTVTLIKDLVVKGANFTAKRGTTVRNISLTSNPEHVEGKVNGTQIVLLSCFLKKA